MLCAPWVVEDDLIGCNCDATGLDPGLLGEIINAASEILHLMSGSIYSGPCSETLRPCRAHATVGGPWSYPTWPVLIEGDWMNIGCGCARADTCSCGKANGLYLPFDHPTSAIVKIDGAVFTAHRLQGRNLYRADGRSWPCCNDLSQADTAAGTWSVAVTHGLTPPAMGRVAARALVVELVRECNGQDCKLPRGTTSFVRQGVSGQTGLTQSAFGQQILQSGIYEVDLFLASFNPAGLRRRGRFWSPDVPASVG